MQDYMRDQNYLVFVFYTNLIIAFFQVFLLLT